MKFLVSAHLPDDFDPSTQDESVARKIHELNAEMEAAGVLFFVAGLMPAPMAKTARASKPGGKVIITDGPYLETKEHIGGFLILDVESEEEALRWAEKGALALGSSIEVRQIFFQEE